MRHTFGLRQRQKSETSGKNERETKKVSEFHGIHHDRLLHCAGSVPLLSVGGFAVLTCAIDVATSSSWTENAGAPRRKLVQWPGLVRDLFHSGVKG
jgi:hypothetical protein